MALLQARASCSLCLALTSSLLDSLDQSAKTLSRRRFMSLSLAVYFSVVPLQDLLSLKGMAELQGPLEMPLGFEAIWY